MKQLLIILYLLALINTGHAQHFESAVAETRALVKNLMDSLQVPGVAVSVFCNGRTWSEGFGYSDLENRIPVIPEISKFRIGSVSKTLTAAGLAKLYELKLLDLEADLTTYYDGFPDKGHSITIRQLAGHLAGVRHYRGNEFLNTQRYASVEAGLSIFKDDPLLAEPGEKYIYSSYGWNLLSMVIEKISGKPYLEFMQTEVFTTLEMNHTVPDFPDKITQGRVRFYRLDHGQLVNCPYVDNSYKWAGGGFLSTSDDLLRFARACLEDRFSTQQTFLEFTRSLSTNSGEKTGYGLGWRNAHDKYGRQWLGHSGGSVGGTSMLVIYPKEKVVVVILTNISQANIGNLSAEIANAFIF